MGEIEPNGDEDEDPLFDSRRKFVEQTDRYKRNDVEILRALRPGLMTTKGQLIAISSPFGKRGELWKAYERHYSKPESRTLVAQAPSIVMNNSLDPAWIARRSSFISTTRRAKAV
jgi:hypothetical protein